MDNGNPYKAAYERERAARLNAEQLLDEKTRTLYESYISLEKALDDLKTSQTILVQSEKMASIGQLAAGVAHEINNPIGFSLSNLSTLTDYMDSFLKMDAMVMTQISNIKDPNFVQGYLALRKAEDIEFLTGDIAGLLSDSIKGLNRVSGIVKSLKKVTHTSGAEKTLCNINDLIEESIKIVWNELKYSMEIERDFAELPLLNCHEGEIEQVLINLFMNAAHACEDNGPNKRGVLRIKTAQKMVNGCLWIIINVTDNGKGISESNLKKIFDPFFTTKPVGVGTGLGLSVTYGIIERHAGKISVESEEGKGATFSISLPVSLP